MQAQRASDHRKLRLSMSGKKETFLLKPPDMQNALADHIGKESSKFMPQVSFLVHALLHDWFRYMTDFTTWLNLFHDCLYYGDSCSS